MLSLSMMVKRNMKLYSSDKQAVIYSMLSMVIILILNLGFLGKSYIDNAVELMNISYNEASILVMTWLFAGIIAVNSLTTAVAVNGLMVQDEEKKRISSFLVSPVGRVKIALSYIISAFIISVGISIITFGICYVYLIIKHQSLFSIFQIIKIIGIIIINSFASSAFAFVLVCAAHSVSQFMGINIIVGTLSGFVTGIYVLVCELPQTIQKLVNYIPIMHGASLMREALLENIMNNILVNSSAESISTYSNNMGISLLYNNVEIDDSYKVLVLLLSGIIFILLSGVILSKKSIKDR